MGNLNELISNFFRDIFKPDEIGLRIIERKFQDFGITLNVEQKRMLTQQLQTAKLNKINISLTDEQEEQLKNNDDSLEEIIIDFGDTEGLNQLDKKIGDIIEDTLSEILSTISDSLLKAWMSQAPNLLQEQKNERSQFLSRIDEIWCKPLDLLEILLSISLEAGSDFNQSFRPTVSQKNNFVVEVLTQLHARACQVGLEILTLLQNGFADGAHARWRTLHEVTIIARFVEKHGNELAERYLYHADILEYKAALNYKDNYDQLGYEPIPQETLDALKARCEALVQRFGKPFKDKQYGWAASVLKNPNFAEIEKSINFDHLRPFYKMANINVHADSRGTYFRLGSPPGNPELLLAGSSIFGIAEPAQNTAYSIYHMNATVLLLSSDFENLAFITATGKLMNEVVWAFDDAAEKLENETGS